MSDPASTISDIQQSSMVNFLRFAGEKYRENARTLMEMSAGEAASRPGNQLEQIAQQFERQADEAFSYADMFENAREITIVPGALDDDVEMAEAVGASFRR